MSNKGPNKSEGQGVKYNPSKLLPKTVSVTTYDPPKPVHPDEEDQQNEDQQISALKVKSVDFNVTNNARIHRTDLYEVTQAPPNNDESPPATLVVRRAQEFTMTLTFDRDVDPKQDKVELVLEIGDAPLMSKGSMVRLTPEKHLRPRVWSCSIQSLEGAKMSVAILSPPECFVGRWRLSVESSLENGNERREVLRYQHPEPVYMILNPFCKDDTVCVEDEAELEEYVLNQTGKIYSGNFRQVTFKPWCYGQFVSPVLEAVMTLLDRSRLNVQSRGNPVALTRALLAVVNARDEEDSVGVLLGDWSGSYENGTAPSHWTGSVPILEEYLSSGKPVKYGQSVAYSGLCTTLCRALGIPTRSVTNFSSAHDCDGSTSIDLHWDERGSPITANNNDHVWTFHVWNEAWMMRPDLDTGYSGWQAFDATPQHTQRGQACAGPVSVRAIREGCVNLPYDASCLFAEVNADRLHWILGDDGSWAKVIQKHVVGKRISTKRPTNAEKIQSFIPGFKEDPDRLDITDSYKFPEGTENERAAILRANTLSARTDIRNKKSEDVKFVLSQKDEILVGNSYDVILKVINKSRECRTVHIVLTLDTIHYTGAHRKTLKTKEFAVELQPIKTEEAVMRVLAEEYLTFITDQASFKVNILAKVEETGQTFADADDFRLRRPDLVIECPARVVCGRQFNAVVKFANSLPEHLTACEWMVESPGIVRAAKHPCKNLEPYDRASLRLSLTADKPGDHQIVASFTSKELTDINGVLNITVTK